MLQRDLSGRPIARRAPVLQVLAPGIYIFWKDSRNVQGGGHLAGPFTLERDATNAAVRKTPAQHIRDVVIMRVSKATKLDHITFDRPFF